MDDLKRNSRVPYEKEVLHVLHILILSLFIIVFAQIRISEVASYTVVPSLRDLR